MVLSREEYLKRTGLPAQISSKEVPKFLTDMMLESIGSYTDDLVVKVSGTVETLDLRLQVSTKGQDLETI